MQFSIELRSRPKLQDTCPAYIQLIDIFWGRAYDNYACSGSALGKTLHQESLIRLLCFSEHLEDEKMISR